MSNFEEAVALGSHDHLMGIWNGADRTLKTGTAVVMVTAGMLHHAGPFRLHVDLARELSGVGIASLRFDLSGIGESFGIGTGGRSIDRAASEISQAIDWIESQHSIKRVVLFGLCSGADDAMQAAVNDARVTGLVAMDGCAYPTRSFYWHRFTGHTLPRLLRLQKWQRLTARLFQGPVADTPASLQPGSDVREFPSRDLSLAQLQQLADRDTRVHFIYTGGLSEHYNHAGQFDAMFPRLVAEPRVTHQYFGELDHVAMLVEDRLKLVSHVVDRIETFVTASDRYRSTGCDTSVDTFETALSVC